MTLIISVKVNNTTMTLLISVIIYPSIMTLLENVINKASLFPIFLVVKPSQVADNSLPYKYDLIWNAKENQQENINFKYTI